MLLIVAGQASAECYVAGEFKGVGAREHDGFSFDKDGMTGQRFMVDLSRKNSRVTPNDMECIEAGFRTLVCFSDIDGRASVETWAVYPESGVAIFTKLRNGVGPLNGGMLMRGKVLGTCGE
jgi:hypothetical protein